MRKLPGPTARVTKIVETSSRIDRTFEEIAAICAKIPAIAWPIVKTCDMTMGHVVMTGSNCDRTNSQERVLDNCNRIVKAFGTTVKICAVIAGSYELIGRTGEEIATIFEMIDGICIMIGRSSVLINNGRATIDSLRFASCEEQKRWNAFTAPI